MIITCLLYKEKAQLRRVTAENDRNKAYRYENDWLKKEIADTDKKHKEEAEKYSAKIKNLTEEIADKEKVISEQAC